MNNGDASVLFICCADTDTAAALLMGARLSEEVAVFTLIFINQYRKKSLKLFFPQYTPHYTFTALDPWATIFTLGCFTARSFAYDYKKKSNCCCNRGLGCLAAWQEGGGRRGPLFTLARLQEVISKTRGILGTTVPSVPSPGTPRQKPGPNPAVIVNNSCRAAACSD